jgi:deoxyribose-phosphate aldolase
MHPSHIARLIDHTLLKPDATSTDIERLCDEARQHAFCSVCVNPTHVQLASRLLASSTVHVCTVTGFPLGATTTEAKVYETRFALRDGATEIDMVLNIGALKHADHNLVHSDIATVVHACREARAICKVIFETCLLTPQEIERACNICIHAGAHFVKTSTGFSTGGATTDAVSLMSRTVKPHNIGVKASGGIRSLADLQRMVEAGATRIGTSSGVKIMHEAGTAA